MIFTYNCTNDYNYLLLLSKKNININNLDFEICYKNNRIYNIFYYNLNKKININYTKYLIFKKIYNNNNYKVYKVYKISNNFLLLFYYFVITLFITFLLFIKLLNY